MINVNEMIERLMSFQSRERWWWCSHFCLPVQIAELSPALLAQFPREINEARGLSRPSKVKREQNNQIGRRSCFGKGAERKETNSTNTPSTQVYQHCVVHDNINSITKILTFGLGGSKDRYR